MSSPFLGSLLFISSVTAFGFLVNSILIGISSLKERFSKNLSPSLRKVPLYFALGTTIYTFWGTLLSIAGIKLSIFTFLILLVLFLILNLFLYGLYFWKNLKPNQWMSGISQIKRGDLFVFAIILVISASIIWKMATRMAFPSFDIDLLGHLLIKAKILLFSTCKDSLFLHDPLFANLHSKYPPMFGILYNLLFLFIGGAFNSYFHVVNYFILFCIGYGVYVFLSERIPRWQAVLWSFICISARNYLKQSYLIDNADIFLSLFLLLAACELFHFFKTGSCYHILSCAVVVSGGALLKNEGLLFMIYLACVFVFYVWRRFDSYSLKQKRKFLFLFAAPASLLLIPWWTYQLNLPSPEKAIFLDSIFTALPYFGNALKLYAKEIFSWKWQGVFALWIILVLLPRPNFRQKISLFSMLGFIQLFSYFFIFSLCRGKEVATVAYSTSGLRRTIAHCYPLILVAVGLIIGMYFLKQKKKLKD